MNPEKVEKIEVKKLIHDERSHKIAGTFLILISFLLFVAFTSYLFTWQQDQSKVLQGAKILLPSHDQVMANALGTAGAYFSDLFFQIRIRNCFLFILSFFLCGGREFICSEKNIFCQQKCAVCNCRPFGDQRLRFIFNAYASFTKSELQEILNFSGVAKWET